MRASRSPPPSGPFLISIKPSQAKPCPALLLGLRGSVAPGPSPLGRAGTSPRGWGLRWSVAVPPLYLIVKLLNIGFSKYFYRLRTLEHACKSANSTTLLAHKHLCVPSFSTRWRGSPESPECWYYHQRAGQFWYHTVLTIEIPQ